MEPSVNQLRAVQAEAPRQPSSHRCSSVTHPAIANSAIDATVARCIPRTRSYSLSGHSTRTAVVTSRLAFADIAHLHQTAERTATTVSALVAQIVHEHARHLADEDHPQTTDDASSISKQGVPGASEVADLPVASPSCRKGCRTTPTFSGCTQASAPSWPTATR